MGSNDKRSNINRRQILKSLGIGVSGVVLPTSSSQIVRGKETDTSDVMFKILSGDKSHKLVTTAQNSREISNLDDLLTDRGYRLYDPGIEAKMSKIDDTVVRSVTFPYIPKEEPDISIAYLLWQTGEHDTYAFVIESDRDFPKSNIHNKFEANGEVLKEIKSIEIISENEHTISFRENSKYSKEVTAEEGTLDVRNNDISNVTLRESSTVKASGYRGCVIDCVGPAGGAVCVLGCGSCLNGSIPACLACGLCGARANCCAGKCGDFGGGKCNQICAIGQLTGNVAFIFICRGCSSGDCSI